MEISTIGLDLAKSIFQVHGITDAGEVAVRKALRRSQVLPFFAKLPPCLVGMEACGTSHHWARELTKLGHEVRLMPPAYVKPYVKRGKTDANDAEAICEAVTRPTMRFVPVKSPEQQAALALHRTRDLLVKQRTQLVNMIRGLLAEFGVEMARGLHHALALAKELTDGRATKVPQLAQRVVTSLAYQVSAVQEQLATLEKELLAWHRSNELSQRLATIPGIGVIAQRRLQHR
jgi:transposase